MTSRGLSFTSSRIVEFAGSCEDPAIWRTVEHHWADVTWFFVPKDEEGDDAVGFSILKDGQRTGKADILMGAYADGVPALAERMNAARAKAPVRRDGRRELHPANNRQQS
ncbi:MAG TPA: hypothetical protein VFJ16_27390 [Longimicrobium sp.]|nr:hypothetical protein [Longimicrobium sp.]